MIKNVIKTIDELGLKEPNRICYDYLGEKHTYGELKERSDAWAKTIVNKHVPDKEPIMIWGGQTFDVVASFLGCVKSGHAYVPIADYSNPSRLEMIEEVSKSPALIVHSELPKVNLDDKMTIIRPFDVTDHGNIQLDESRMVKGDDNFYIIFTSGTNGKPKGVQISNDGGIDGYGYHIDDNDFRTPRVVIQCKRYNVAPVSEPEINQFLGAMNKYQADYGVFITNGRFTNAARIAAREGSPITLIDGNELVRLVIRYELYITPVKTYVLDEFYSLDE